MNKQLVYIIGDLHGDWRSLNEFINKKIRFNKKLISEAESGDLEIIFLQVGDFGWWPHAHSPHNKKGLLGKFDQYGIKNQVDFLKDGHIKIYWCPGNHENWDDLDRLSDENPSDDFIEVQPYVYYATFGSVLTLANGKNVLFVGGADSIDKDQRTLGIDWWQQETIQYSDFELLPNRNDIDIIISHTCPNYFDLSEGERNGCVTDLINNKGRDSSKFALDSIYDQYKPSQWFFGHYHWYKSGKFENCDWQILSYPTSNLEWKTLL